MLPSFFPTFAYWEILRLVEVVVPVAVGDIAFVGCPFDRQEETVTVSEQAMLGMRSYLIANPCQSANF